MRSYFFASLLASLLFTAAPASQGDLTGTWAVSFTTAQGQIDATAVFKQDGEALTGTLTGPQGEIAFKGTVKGKAFSVTLDVQTQNGPLSIRIDGEQNGDDLKGTFDFGQGSGEWVGRRSK